MKILAFMKLKLFLFKVQYQAQTFKIKYNRRKTLFSVDVDEKINKLSANTHRSCVAYKYEIHKY